MMKRTFRAGAAGMAKPIVFAGMLLSMATALGLMACGTDPGSDKDHLEIKSGPSSSLHAGDTTDFWLITKVARDATGRSVTTNNYTSFVLASSDPSVAAIVQNQRVLALKAGSAKIIAKDQKSDAVSDSASVTVQ